MKLIVGLGNPGSKYARTRHNAGVWAVEAIAEKLGFSDWVKKYDGLFSTGKVKDEKICALLPQTFMNLSGQSVRAACASLGLKPEHVIVFHDELDVAPGKVKAKTGGGAGGHNGLKSIDELVGKNYHRIRIGIGHPGHADLVSDYVLSLPLADEMSLIKKVVDALTDSFEALVTPQQADIAGYLNEAALILKPKSTKLPNDVKKDPV